MKKIFYCLFALILGIASIFIISDNVSVGAWSFDNEGNLVSDNLFDVSHYNSYMSFQVNNTAYSDFVLTVVTSPNVTSNYFTFNYDSFMPNGVSQYYNNLWISFYMVCLNQDNSYFDFTSNNGSTSTRYTLTNRGQLYKFEFLVDTSFDLCKFTFPNSVGIYNLNEIMVTAESDVGFYYEPYGVWTSSSNLQEIINEEKSILINNYYSYVRSLESQITEKNSIISQLNSQIDTLSNQVSSNFGWSTFFFGLLDVPLKIMTSVLNYDIMGINLYNAFMGLLTALALIWVLKRFLK